MEEEERERKKYIYLKGKLNKIKNKAITLESKVKELEEELNNGLLINDSIAEKDDINDIKIGIKNSKSSISQTIRIANRKI